MKSVQRIRRVAMLVVVALSLLGALEQQRAAHARAHAPEVAAPAQSGT